MMITSAPISVHRVRPAMGTLFEVLLRGEDEEHLAAVAEAILDEVQRIELLLSRFDPRSEISRINRLAAREAVQVDCEVAAVLKTCFDACEWTGGAFDISAASRRAGSLGQRSAAAVTTGGQAGTGLVFDPDRRVIRFTSPGIGLDFGGIGKGYALDRAAELLHEYHVEHALLHGGTSSVLARGTDADQPWRVAFPGGSPECLELQDEALSCSAIDEQADIIDPATCRPVAGRAAVAVVAPTATEAEIVSTALLCLDRTEAEALIARWSDSTRKATWCEPARLQGEAS